MKRNQILHQVLALVLTIAALMVGQQAMAESKTVTYTITSIESINLNYDIVFTRSGDDPFDTEAPSTYTVTVSPSVIGQTSGGAGGFSVELADGFSLQLHWGTDSDIRFSQNCIYPHASNKLITYDVSCDNANYYVTHVMMTGFESNLQSGMLDFSNNKPIDTDYDSAWNFQHTYRSRYSFGQITVTYSDTPPLSIFESAGTDTYKIQSKDDLRHLANYVNNGKNECSGLTFLQTQDITCDDTYVPIGYYKKNSNKARFSGTYDGQGHTVSDITVSRTATDSEGGYIGLFSYVNEGTVENVVLANSTFTGSESIGGIVGYNSGGTVQNCRVESTVTIKAGCNNALHHGGIVGGNSGSRAKVIGCYSAASIQNNGKSGHTLCGGIAGNNYGGTIQDCLYTGNTIEAADKKGGIVGYSEGSEATFTNNYYTSVSIGGVAGSDRDGARRARTVNLGENVALVGDETAYSVSSLTAIGTGNYALRYTPLPLEGTGEALYSGKGQTLTFSYTGEDPAVGYQVTWSATAGTISGNTLTMPASDVTVTATIAPIPWEGNGTADDPYQISNYAELKQFANIVNGTGGEAYAKLVDDIVCKNSSDDTEFATDWVPIGNASHPYTGTFDGDGYTITGLSTPNDNTSDYVGLFGYLGSNGVVKDVILEYATMTGNSNVGVVAGYNNGTLTGNYYISCSANNATANIGTGSGDCDGARGLFTITLPEGVTAATATITLDYTDYFVAGTTVTLSGTPPEGFAAPVVYSLNGTTIAGNTFTMPAEDVTVTAAFTDVWGVTNDADGSKEYPYIITTTTGLDLLAKNVNGTDGYTANNFDGKFFKLGADITYSYEGLGADESNFTAIGGYFDGRFKIFRGIFDGDNKTISGIHIRKGSDDYQGLFGMVSGGTIKNVTLTDADITGMQEVGGIAGYICINAGTGSIMNCHVTSSVAIHAVADDAYEHGGIVGQVNGGSVSGCTSAATLTVAEGLTDCECYGGIVGYGNGNLENNLVVGASISGNTQVGAVAGYINSYNTYSTNYYRNCTVNGTANATGVGVGTERGVSDTPHDIDGVRSVHTLTLGTDITATGESVEISGETYYAAGTTVTLTYSGTPPEGYLYSVNGETISGNTFTMPASDVTVTATVAPIPWEGEGSGTEDDPYQISNYAELKQFANIVNGSGGEAYTYASAKLVNDIVCKNSFGDPEYATDWVPIGNASHPYIGTFDGQGHTIMGLSTPTDNTSDYVGLFGYIGSEGVVKNVILEYASMTGNSNVGVVAGYNNGTLTNNYYTNCSANDATTNIGTGSGDCDGARSIYVLTANEHDGNYWTTFYSSKAGYKINDDENACAYTATYASATLTLHKLGKVIPAGTAVVIVGSDNSIGLTASSEAAEYTVENKLRGVDEWTLKSELGTGTGTVYVMGKVDGNFGFFEYTGTYMPAHKAYLLISSSSVNGFKMEFEEDDATSIQTLSNSPLKGENIYNLAGQRLNKMQKGINIVNGKKILK